MEIDPAQIWSLDYRLVASVISGAAPGLAELGLEAKELFILADIAEHPYPAALASALCIPKATITVYLKRLEGAGLIRREIDREDLRRYRLEITPLGRETREKGSTLLCDVFSSRLTRLDESEQATLLGLLRKMV